MNLKTACVVLMLLGLTGCTNVWRDSYRPIYGAERLADDAAIELREIPSARMEIAIGEAETRAIESDVHPSQWDEATTLEARAELLRNLQVSADPETTRVVGVSSFRTTNTVRPWDGNLEVFARQVGGNLVVWSDRYLGKAQTIVDRTVYVDSFGYGNRYDGDRDDDRGRFRTEVATVPVVVEKDERGYTAFFLHVDERRDN